MLDHFGPQFDSIREPLLLRLDDVQPIYFKPLFRAQLEVGKNKSR